MRIIPFAALTLPLLALPLSAIPVPVLAQSLQTVAYQCEGGRAFSVEYGQDVAQLRLDAVNVIPLPQVVSGSGVRYSNGSTTLYSKGNQAFIEEGGQRTYSNCVAQTPTVEQTQVEQTQPAPTPARAVEPEPVRGMW